MKQYTQREFIRIVQKNGYLYSRHNGDHTIYVKNGRHISIPHKLKCVIARRLIREHKLKLNLRKNESLDN